jgi:hypothetical protein
MTLEEGRQGSSLAADNGYATPRWLVEQLRGCGQQLEVLDGGVAPWPIMSERDCC